MRDSIVIERVIKSSIDKVFDAFVTPETLVKWHHAGDGWQTPYAEVDPKVGGKIVIGYANPEGVVVFDFVATIVELDRPKRLAYRLGVEDIIKDDDRLVTIDFVEVDGGTKIILELDVEHINSSELQRRGWTEHIDNLESLLKSNQGEKI